MKATICNRVTGEVFTCQTICPYDGTVINNSLVVKALRGIIRQWMKTGLNIHEFDVLEWSDIKLYYYFRQYAWDRMITKCDVCGKVTTNGQLDWIDDSEGVSMFNMCKGGNCQPVNNDWMWEIGEDMKA